MSIQDESFDRSICSFCKCEIEYGTKTRHLKGKCLDDDFWLHKFQDDYPEDHLKKKYDEGTYY